MTTPYTLSAGAVIVRMAMHGPRYLLLRAYDYWDFPKGIVEEGEAPFEAAIREIEEETTLTGLRFPWGAAYRETPTYGRGKIARYYLAESPCGEVHLPVSPELGHPEHDEFRWLSFEEVIPLIKERLHPVITWAHETVMREGIAGDSR
ncbi:MAG: NUDIX domain-containing protein [Gammaproteobacteria bacterium]|nr:NUDIX domain-containing protein [Gammaproteobacteria bacterium]